MYKVFKPIGAKSNVSIENTDTLATLVIGNADMTVRKILEEGGYTLPPITEEWNIEVNSETAKALATTAMSMKKPIRDQRKKVEDKPAEKTTTDIDAFDLIFGSV